MNFVCVIKTCDSFRGVWEEKKKKSRREVTFLEN